VRAYAFSSKTCSGGCNQYQVSPNPVTSNSINIIVPNIPGPCTPPPVELKSNSVESSNKETAISEVKIYNQSGVVMKSKKAKSVKQLSVDLTGLISGIYFIEISNGTYKETQQLIIQK